MEYFPSEKCNFSTQMSCFAHYFDTFELLFRKHLRGVDFVFFEKFPEDRSSGGQHYKKNRSYECRHQSDTVCHNIFDSYTYDSTRHPLNTTQIDKIMPYHQTWGSSIVEAYVGKQQNCNPLYKRDASQKF